MMAAFVTGCGGQSFAPVPMAGLGVDAAGWDKYKRDNVFVNLDPDSITFRKGPIPGYIPEVDIELVAQIKGGSKLTVTHNTKKPNWSEICYRGTPISNAQKRGWAKEALQKAVDYFK